MSTEHQPVGAVYEAEAVACAVLGALRAWRAPRELWLRFLTMQ